MSHDAFSRRRFLKLGAAGAVAVPLGAVTVRSHADGVKMVSEDDPTAKALAYYANAADVDKGAYPNFDPSQNCANCIQYKGEEGSETGPCALFPGKHVTAAGWCKVWVKG